MEAYIFDPGYNDKKVISNKALYLMALSHIGFYVIPNVFNGVENIKNWSTEKVTLTDDDPRWLNITLICPSSAKLTNSGLLSRLKECGFNNVEVKHGVNNEYIIDLRDFQYEEDSIVEDNKSYKWVFDTIRVYVADTYNGGSWTQELDLIDNDINKTLKEYKKTLGKGYWLDYIGPGKMHKNKDYLSEENLDNNPLVYSDDTIKVYELPDNVSDWEKIFQEKGLKFTDNIRNLFYPEFYYLLAIFPGNNSCLIEVHSEDNELSDILLLNINNGKSIIDDYGLAKSLIEEPSLYNLLVALKIKVSGDESGFNLAADFRDKFKGESYNKALKILDKMSELARYMEPFQYESYDDYILLDALVHSPSDFIDSVQYMIDELNDYDLSEKVNIAKNLKKEAEDILFPDSVIEQLN